MKIFPAVLTGLVYSQGPDMTTWGADNYDEISNPLKHCGGQYTDDTQKVINSTCTATFSTPPTHLFAGAGAFVRMTGGAYEFSAFDGMSDTAIDLVWEIVMSDDGNGGLDNSTCIVGGDDPQGSVTVDCVDGGGPWTGPVLMETINTHVFNKEGAVYNIQVANYGAAGDTLSFGFMDADSQGVGVQNITGDCTGQTDSWGNEYSDDGTVACTIVDDAPLFFHFSITIQPGQTSLPSMWHSTVV